MKTCKAFCIQVKINLYENKMKTENSQQRLKDKTEALIALAAQKSEAVEEPPDPVELTDFFANSRRFSKQRQDQIMAYLDSNPEAYERWIKQGKEAARQRSAPVMFWRTPYAIATCVLLMMIGVGLFWRGQTFELEQAIDNAYQVVISNEDSENLRQTMASLADALQQTNRPLSFSQSGQLSHLAQAFKIGLQHDWQVFDREPLSSTPLANARQEDYQLGRWHTLLYAVSQQEKAMPVDFWQDQLKILDHLQTQYSKRQKEENTAEVRAILLQLDQIKAILQQLAQNGQIVKSYRQLEQALTALRFSLIPVL
jgi:hypothetical protein